MAAQPAATPRWLAWLQRSPQIPFTGSTNHTCDVCQAKSLRGVIKSCRECDFDMCQDCAAKVKEHKCTKGHVLRDMRIGAVEACHDFPPGSGRAGPAWDKEWDRGASPPPAGAAAAPYRHIFFVRHGQYVIKDRDDVLTDLGREQAAATGARLASLVAALPSGVRLGRLYVSDKTRAKQTAAIILARLPRHGLRVEGAPPDADLNECDPNSQTNTEKLERVFNRYLWRARPDIAITVPELDVSDVSYETGKGCASFRAGDGQVIYSWKGKPRPPTKKLMFNGTDIDMPDINKAVGNLPQDRQRRAQVLGGLRSLAHRAGVETNISGTMKMFEDGSAHEVDIVVGHANVMRYLWCRAMQVPTKHWLNLCPMNCSVTYLRISPHGSVSLRFLGDVGHLEPKQITFNDRMGFS